MKYVIMTFFALGIIFGFVAGNLLPAYLHSGMSDEEVYYEVEDNINWVIDTQGDMLLSDFRTLFHNKKDRMLFEIHRNREIICNGNYSL